MTPDDNTPLIEFTVPGDYWLTTEGPQPGSIPLGYCESKKELEEAVKEAIDVGSEDLIWSNWKASI